MNARRRSGEGGVAGVTDGYSGRRTHGIAQLHTDRSILRTTRATEALDASQNGWGKAVPMGWRIGVLRGRERAIGRIRGWQGCRITDGGDGAGGALRSGRRKPAEAQRA